MFKNQLNLCECFVVLSLDISSVYIIINIINRVINRLNLHYIVEKFLF